MGFIANIQLSLHSLTLVSVLPFLYFGIQSKYARRSEIRKRLEWLLSTLAVTLAGLLFLKLVIARPANVFAIQVYLLHLAPPVLTLLLLSHRGPVIRKGAGSRKYGSSSTADFQPVKKSSQDLTWDDVVIAPKLKLEFQSVIDLLKSPQEAKRYGIDVPKGILLNGPPGTGKTTIARVIASTAGLSFFAVKSDEVISKWVGESEKNLSKLFEMAQHYAPSVVFIDEIDTLGKKRSGKGQQWAENLLNHMLQLIDGVFQTEGIYVIGATNRAELVDSALLRAGRLNKVIEIPCPDEAARRRLFEMNLKKLHLESDVDLHALVSATSGRSGADIKEICNQAGLNAFKRESGEKKKMYTVSRMDLEEALHEFLQQPVAA